MRAGLNTIQQTLTPEALSVLNSSIAEAGRRNHGQTTPLHVAAALLSSPTGYLRRACIKSHPNSSHPLQCRALELCFTVALDRIPTTQSSGEPPISNALMAALKRAQAHQRRGCPEQQQQPLLAVKVELEQLIMSILDDPSVSRVMREASFSSPAVKATIEQSLNTAPPSQPPQIELGFRSPSTTPILSGRNLYLNPRLQGGAVQTGPQKIDEVKKLIDILLRKKKKNPVLVGDSEPENVIKELFKRIEMNQLENSELKNIRVIPLEKEIFSEKSEIPTKIEELKNSIESRLRSSIDGSVVLHLGDLKWLVEHPPVAGAPAAAVSEAGKVAVSEIGKLVSRFGDGRFWLIGMATCETYLRCQVYYPSLENDWDLHAIPIASRAPLPGLFPRIEGNGIVSSSVQSVTPIPMMIPAMTPMTAVSPTRSVSKNFDCATKTSCCPQCLDNYEQELAKYEAEEAEKSSSELKTEASTPSLPPWLKNAKADGTDRRTQAKKEKDDELRKKWNDSCLLLHPSFHTKSSEKSSSVPVPRSLYNPNLLSSEKISPVPVSRSLYNPNLLNSDKISPVPVPRNPNFLSSEKISSVPRNPDLLISEKISPVPVPKSLYNPNLLRNSNLLSSESSVPVPKTLYNPNLLGNQSMQPKLQPKLQLNKNVKESLQLNMISKLEKPADRVVSPPGSPVGTNLVLGQNQHKILADKLLSILDPDPFKKLLKTLTDKLWWQKEAASAVATTVMQCKLGNGKRRSGGLKGDTWLLFVGPDRVGKRKMASALAETVTGSNPVIISLGSKNVDSNASFRGRTAMDRITETIRRNPSSVIMLEEIDEADLLVRGSIKRALEKGRLTDSHGREISISNIVFILTANWLPDNIKHSSENYSSDEHEQKIYSLASSSWQLRLCISDRRTKRRAEWQENDDRSIKQRSNIGFGFDLNEIAEVEDDRADGSFNSSEITVEGDDDRRIASSLSREIRDTVDDAIVFKRVELDHVKQTVRDAIMKRWSLILGETIMLEVQETALEKITAGMWLGTIGMDEWVEKSLVPGFRQLNARFFDSTEPITVRLEIDSEMGCRSQGEWLPDTITVAV